MRSRVVDHEEEDGIPGLVSMRGVKLTTARAEAEKTVDLVFRRLGRPAPRCRTATTVLPAARPLEGSVAEMARRAVRDEMAVHLTDVVLRRADLGTAGPPAEVDLAAVASAVAQELGWDEGAARAERQDVGGRYSAAEAPISRAI
jgi:glycerol-3-phosphate dehydrogenase